MTLIFDGSRGEGGGQILRTSLSMAALTGRPFRLENIRANRSRGGLRPQHLTAVLAAAEVCQAELKGAEINSQTLEFIPQAAPQNAYYRWDVNDVAPHGSAGAITLILQTVLWPLLFASEPSHINLVGGTHVPYSPNFHYLQNVFVPCMRRFGVNLQLDLIEWGWLPKGGGHIKADIKTVSRLEAADFQPESVDTVNGLAVVTNLPGHIPHRMSRRTYNLLKEAGKQSAVQALRLRSGSTGAGTFLWLPNGQAGFSCLGREGLAAQTVAERVVDELLAFAATNTAVDAHMADQLLIPASLAHGTTHFSAEKLTQHTLTNAAMLKEWLGVEIDIKGELDEPAEITVHGINYKGDHGR